MERNIMNVEEFMSKCYWPIGIPTPAVRRISASVTWTCSKRDEKWKKGDFWYRKINMSLLFFGVLSSLRCLRAPYISQFFDLDTLAQILSSCECVRRQVDMSRVGRSSRKGRRLMQDNRISVDCFLLNLIAFPCSKKVVSNKKKSIEYKKLSLKVFIKESQRQSICLIKYSSSHRTLNMTSKVE